MLANEAGVWYNKNNVIEKGCDSVMTVIFTGVDIDDMIFGERDTTPSER